MGGETDEEEQTKSGEPATKKKRHVTFNSDWTKKETFAEWVRPTQGDPFSATCIVCPAKVIVKYEGKMALDNHAKTKKHQTAILNKRQNRAIATFMTKKGSPEEDRVAAAELTSVYHGVLHGHSYLSTDCGIKVNTKIFHDSSIASKVSCG